MLTRAQSLRCIHLSGNEGLTDEMIEWLKVRIRGARATPANNILPPRKTAVTAIQEAITAPPQKQDIFKLFGKPADEGPSKAAMDLST